MSVASLNRRRALARTLHEPRRGGKFETLERSIRQYRERAAAIFARLVELEHAGNDNIAPIRRALILCSEQVESLARLVGVEPTPLVPAQEWIDAPTMPRRVRARGSEGAPGSARLEDHRSAARGDRGKDLVRPAAERKR